MNVNDRLYVLKNLNTLVIELGDEDIYAQWICTVPDQADDVELLSIAQDKELFNDAIETFNKVMVGV